MIRVVIADDHPVVLAGLKRLLELETDFEVVACCVSGEDAIESVRCHHPDVLILDLRMPGKDGLTVAAEIRQARLPTRIVLITAEADDARFGEAILLEVRGVILKEATPRALVECVRAVHAGHEWWEHEVLIRALAKVAQFPPSAVPMTDVLTPRELEIVRLVGAGLRNRQIAERLGVTEGTVKIHLHNVYDKLGASGRLELMRYAHGRGLA